MTIFTIGLLLIVAVLLLGAVVGLLILLNFGVGDTLRSVNQCQVYLQKLSVNDDVRAKLEER